MRNYSAHYSSHYSAPKYLHNYPPPSAQKKWPQDIQCIIRSTDPEKGSLYLSNVEAAENPATVRRLKVGAIMTCAKGYKLSHSKQLVPYYMYIEGEDKESFNISEHFEAAVQFIDQAINKTNIIVHCIAGVSRSVSMVIAYLIKIKGMSYTQAFQLVKSRRKIICPNDGFIAHLKQYQRKLHGSSGFTSPSKKQPSLMESATKSSQKPYHKYDVYERVESMKQHKGQGYQAKNPECSSTSFSSSSYYLNTTTTPNPKTFRNTYEYITSTTSPKKNYQRKYNTSQHDQTHNRSFSKSVSYIPQSSGSGAATATTATTSTGTSNRIAQRLERLQRERIERVAKVKASIASESNSKRVVQPINLTNNYSRRPASQSDSYRSSTTANKNTNNIGSKLNTGYYDSASTELNQKIQLIRKKYEAQRQQMLSKYGTKKHKGGQPLLNNNNNINSSCKNSTADQYYPLSQQNKATTTLNTQTNTSIRESYSRTKQHQIPLYLSTTASRKASQDRSNQNNSTTLISHSQQRQLLKKYDNLTGSGRFDYFKRSNTNSNSDRKYETLETYGSGIYDTPSRMSNLMTASSMSMTPGGYGVGGRRMLY